MAIILAIDPGSRFCGWALFNSESNEIIDSGVDKFDSKKFDAIDRLTILEDLWSHRLRDGELNGKMLLSQFPPNFIAIERQFSTGNSADAILAVASFIIRRIARKFNLRCLEVSAMTVKKRVVGKGNVSKQVVREFLQLKYPEIKFISDDHSDAVAVALATIEEFK